MVGFKVDVRGRLFDILGESGILSEKIFFPRKVLKIGRNKKEIGNACFRKKNCLIVINS